MSVYLFSVTMMFLGSHFYPSGRWARRGIVIHFVRRRLRRRRTHSSGYYTNMVQQIEFIQTFNPSLHFFLPKVIGQGQRFKKNLVNAIT